MAKTRKIPLRKSVVSGEVIDKRDLLRIVKNKDGEVFIDPTGKQNGRGACLLELWSCICPPRCGNMMKHGFSGFLPCRHR